MGSIPTRASSTSERGVGSHPMESPRPTEERPTRDPRTIEDTGGVDAVGKDPMGRLDSKTYVDG